MNTRGARRGSRARPRVVASDLDGTLLRPDGSVSPHTAAVWQALAGAGVDAVVVTARPPRWLDHLADLFPESATGTRSVAICANGAFVYDARNRTVLERSGYTRDEALDVVTHVLAEFGGASVAFETDQGAFRTRAFLDGVTPLGVDDDMVVDQFGEVPADVVVGKILVRHRDWRDDAFVADVTQCLGERGVLAYSGARGLAEISAPGITKAARLADWCAERGVDAVDVWAFGDMPNDIPMLSWAGRGVAVADAHLDAVAAADDRCGSNTQDGVAVYLAERLGLTS